jgi:hypothetical protein
MTLERLKNGSGGCVNYTEGVESVIVRNTFDYTIVAKWIRKVI